MICGCCKDIGCYSYNDTIHFETNGGNIVSVNENSPYVFHIWNNGTYQRIEQVFTFGDPIVIQYTFNENSETTIKIELPNDAQNPVNGIVFVTTADGACCFTAHGTLSTCN